MLMHQKNHAPNHRCHRFLCWHAGCTARSCTGEKTMVWSWRSLSLRHWNAGWNFQAINSQLVALENLNPTIQHPTCIHLPLDHWSYENFHRSFRASIFSLRDNLELESVFNLCVVLGASRGSPATNLAASRFNGDTEGRPSPRDPAERCLPTATQKLITEKMDFLMCSYYIYNVLYIISLHIYIHTCVCACAYPHLICAHYCNRYMAMAWPFWHGSFYGLHRPPQGSRQVFVGCHLGLKIGDWKKPNLGH